MLITPHRPRHRLGVGLIVLVALSTAASAQTPPQAPPVFRGAAELVEVIVRVTDAQGRFVPGLTQAEFEIREEGRAQTIVAFNTVDLPRPPVRTAEASQPPLRSPVSSTVATNAETAESRAFVLLLDDMLTSPASSRSARQAARDFVQRFVGPTDLVAAFSTGGMGVQTQEFTTDKTRVLTTIDRFLGRRCRSQANSLNTGSARDNAFRQESHPEQIYDVRVVTDVIENLARHLSTIRGRRVSLLWISEGIDYNVQNPAISGAVGPGAGSGPDPAAVLNAIQKAIDALQRANVTLYSIDPRRAYAAEQLLPEELPEGMQPETTSNPLCREANRQELTRSLDTLREFSQKTGGFAAVNTNEFGTAFDRVLDDSSQYYLLGYQPTSRGSDGQFKRLEVRTRRPGLQVSARTAYVVSGPRPPAPGPAGIPPALAAVLTSSIPTAGLPLRVQAVPRRGSDNRGLVYVIVEIPGKELQFTEADGRFTERIDFGLIAIDALARQSSVQPVAMELSLTAAQLSQVRATGVRWLTSVSLPPGAYNFRVAAQGRSTNRTGSIFLDVNVPAFDADRLQIDGVALTSLPAALGITSGISSVGLGLPSPPTAMRTFVRGDVLTLSAEVGAAPRVFTRGTLDLSVRLQTADAKAPAALQRTFEVPDRATAEAPRAFAIDTAKFSAGAYVLTLTLRDMTGKSVETGVLFDVVERPGQ